MAQVTQSPSEGGNIKGDPPKVSALVPCYNAAEFLQKTLDCLVAQTWPNLEILIADDCSTDNTLDVVRAFAKGRQNVRVLERSQNLGWLKNTNDLMANAAGELMFFAFHDDVVAPDYVEQLANALGNNPDAILAFSDMEVFEVDNRSRIWKFEQISGHISALRRGYLMVGTHAGWWVPNRGVFRAQAFDLIGGIKPNVQGEYSADWTWLLHMSLLGEFVRVPKVLCRKYYKKNSLSKTWPHDPEQRNALRHAGIKEIEMSPIEPAEKKLLEDFLMTRELAEQGDANAQYDLGLLYCKGQGMLQNYAVAAKWYSRAAEQHHANAQADLGIMYANGQGVTQDYAEAVKWCRTAAEQGVATAQNNLGAMYDNGQGVPQDYVEAYMWFNLAGAQGNKTATNNRDIVAKRMTPAQIAEAERRAANWRPRR